VHFPEAGTPTNQLMAAATPAHRRLIFEELFYLELGLELKRRRLREREGTAFMTENGVRKALKQILPFHPTAAQKRVLGEIAADMRKPQPMRRLLQGDVGSGKTIVAMQAALIAIENGYQAALMAPTEILATQHYLSARKLLDGAISPRTGKPYRVTLLTGSLDDASKREARGRIYRGETQLAIGTHALIEEKVDFDNLGLVIVDEQHRFGVQQRFRLMKKPGADGRSSEPDVLVMTATPIPRTLALTLYGDLETSVIDELPPGRSPVVTRRTTDERAEDVWAFVRKQVAAGQQAYIVYPVIEGAKDDQPELDFAHDETEEEAVAIEKKAASSTQLRSGRNEKSSAQKKTKGPKTDKLFAPKKALRAATDMYEELRSGALAGLRLGLLHGRLSADDKEIVMRRFQRGEIDVLIATTVIEVGVDVPNASVMVIEHAERFGLAQMHQLRGRVGRGATKSYCILMTGGQVSEQADARLNAMVATQNGFELAELDLEQRGPGEFFGTRQAGMPEFRVANLLRGMSCGRD
jgi:ATP-dependent DNA helicase RecG